MHPISDFCKQHILNNSTPDVDVYNNIISIYTTNLADTSWLPEDYAHKQSATKRMIVNDLCSSISWVASSIRTQCLKDKKPQITSLSEQDIKRIRAFCNAVLELKDKKLFDSNAKVHNKDKTYNGWPKTTFSNFQNITAALIAWDIVAFKTLTFDGYQRDNQHLKDAVLSAQVKGFLSPTYDGLIEHVNALRIVSDIYTDVRQIPIVSIMRWSKLTNKEQGTLICNCMHNLLKKYPESPQDALNSMTQYLELADGTESIISSLRMLSNLGIDITNDANLCSLFSDPVYEYTHNIDLS